MVANIQLKKKYQSSITFIKKKYQTNIVFRYLSIASVFLLVVQLVMVGIHKKRAYNQAGERLESKVDKYGDFLSLTTRNAFLSRDLMTFEELANLTVQDHDLVYCIFLDNQQQVLGFELKQTDSISKFLAKKQLSANYSQNLIEVLQKKQAINEVHNPIVLGDRKIGEIRLGYSKNLVQNQFKSAILLGLVYSMLVSILFATLTLLIFKNQILTPIRKIKHAATKFATGNLETRIELARQDEIGELGNALNSMASQLEYSLSNVKEVMNEALIAEKAKGQFLGRMSHELKTPLNGIIGFTQLMKQDHDATKEQLDNLVVIEESSLRLLKLINDVLEITQIESGQLTLNSKVFDLHALLDSLANMFQFKAQEKKLKFKFRIGANVPLQIENDEDKLRKVIANLLDNAVKFTAKGKVTFSVKKTNKNSGNPFSTLYFKITDTGKGISPEEIDALFVTFAKTDDASKTLDGMGLGLPASKQLIELMGGELSISSEKERGTIIRFSLPINEVESIGIDLDNSGFFDFSDSEDESVESQFFHDSESSYQLTEKKLEIMPGKWLLELQEATIKVDNELIFAVLEKLPNQDRELIKALTDLIHNFRYDSILELTDKALAKKIDNLKNS